MLPARLFARSGSTTLRLEQLYRIRYTSPESWVVRLEGEWEQRLFLAEGRCEGSISGRFRGANFPHRRTAAGPLRPDFRAVIDTDDGAAIMFVWHGYGRVYPPGRGQIVGAVFHLSDSDRYRRLNHVICLCLGEVRAPDDPNRESSNLVIDVAEPVEEWFVGKPDPARSASRFPVLHLPNPLDGGICRCGCGETVARGPAVIRDRGRLTPVWS
jgi:hypothetical protein